MKSDSYSTSRISLGPKLIHVLRTGLLAAVAGLVMSVAAHAQRTLTPDVNDVLKKLNGINVEELKQKLKKPGATLDKVLEGKLSAKERAVLFAHNDKINAARLNGEIPDNVYQIAQNDFANTNKRIARESAEAVGATFDVQKPSTGSAEDAFKTFSPGTDSDYITVVENKNQIRRMQDGYNARINEHLRSSGIENPPRKDWHNKLDTDFMADPRKVKSPKEFREIAKLNNDAYKSRYAAEYERISRAKDGSKIGPEHVNGYMREMNDFAKKKGSKIDDMFAKGPSYFNDPAKRAEIFQTMAQEQKYISRLESLDDFLRKQEGLPPRKRGLTAAKLGSNRAPGNAANIRGGHAVADASRFSAMEDIAETMSEVAKKNPGFNRHAADDIAKIIEGLPASRRAAALQRIRARGGAQLVDNVVLASARAGRLPPGSGSLADDLTKTGVGRKALGAASKALEAIGKAADAAEVVTAAAQLKTYVDNIRRALDPNTPEDEARALFEEARKISEALAGSSALAAIMERHPSVAVIYGAWTVACAAGEWVSPSKEANQLMRDMPSGGACLDRHVRAWDRARDWWSGKLEEDREHTRVLCGKFMKAVREKRVTLRGDFTVKDVCDAIARRDPISDMIHKANISPDDVKIEKPAPPPVALVPPTCDVAGNAAIVANLREAAAAGSEEAAGHITRVNDVNAKIASAKARYETAKSAYATGDFGRVRTLLGETKAIIGELGSGADCDELSGKVAKGLAKADEMEGIIGQTRAAIESCDTAALSNLVGEYGTSQNGGLRPLMTRGEGVLSASRIYDQAKAAYGEGNLAGAGERLAVARSKLNQAGGGVCPKLAGKLARGLDRVDRAQTLIGAAQQAVANCDAGGIARYKGRLARLSNPAFSEAKSALANAVDDCRRREAAASAARAKTAAENRQARCVKDHGAGYVVGHILEDGRFFCKPTKPVADAWCSKNNGAGHYAVNINSRGGFGCLPTKAVANRWCNRNNAGSGWYAGKIKSDGTYGCHQSKRGQRRTALRSCRKKYGKRFIRLVRRKGQYLCEYQSRSTARRQPRRRRTQQGYDPQAAAAAAAVAGAIIQGIAASQARKRARRTQRRCHRNPNTGRMHCGSN